jgi:molybdenum cofactor cytidylyltransferase
MASGGFLRRVGIIILAAGASTRYGQPKQLLPFQGRSLIRHAVASALETDCRSITVVTGANAESAEAELIGLPILIARNEDWEQGMGASIRCGLQAMLDAEAAGTLPTDAVILMLCDQPFVTPAFLDDLIYAHLANGKDIVASKYNGTVGVPVLFSRKMYPELLATPSHAGAKKLIQQFPEKTYTISFEKGSIDVDTPEDYKSLLSAVPASLQT